MKACGNGVLVFAMNQSLDGYVDHQEFAPDPSLLRHFVEHMRGLTGSVYGRVLYEVMRYWDETIPSGRRGTRLRRGVAQPTEVGGIPLVEVSRPQRHAYKRRGRGGGCSRPNSLARLTLVDQTWREA